MQFESKYALAVEVVRAHLNGVSVHRFQSTELRVRFVNKQILVLIKNATFILNIKLEVGKRVVWMQFQVKRCIAFDSVYAHVKGARFFVF
jgi:hypothetical protein